MAVQQDGQALTYEQGVFHVRKESDGEDTIRCVHRFGEIYVRYAIDFSTSFSAFISECRS